MTLNSEMDGRIWMMATQAFHALQSRMDSRGLSYDGHDFCRLWAQLALQHRETLRRFPFHEARVWILQVHGICVFHGSGVIELGWRERSFDGFRNIKLAFCSLRFSSGVWSVILIISPLDRGIHVTMVTISKVIKVGGWHSHPSTLTGDLLQGEIWKFGKFW